MAEPVREISFLAGEVFEPVIVEAEGIFVSFDSFLNNVTVDVDDVDLVFSLENDPVITLNAVPAEASDLQVDDGLELEYIDFHERKVVSTIVATR